MPAPRMPHVQLICSYEPCGKCREVLPFKAKRIRYCSPVCAMLARRGRRSEWRTLLCAYEPCQAPFEVPPSQITKGRRFCSNACRHAAKRRRVTLLCKSCRKPFVVRPKDITQGRQYCSYTCMGAGQNRRIALTCETCGNSFLVEPNRIRQGRKFCSRQCYKLARAGRRPVACCICGKEVLLWPGEIRPSGNYCSRACLSIAQNHQVTVVCIICGKVFRIRQKNIHPQGNSCSRRCGHRARVEQVKVYPNRRARHLAASERRRVALKQAPFIETVLIDVLYLRDRGICQLCYKRCSKKAATVDHVIPLSLGGAHSYQNTVLAHHSCNSKKSNRLIPQQQRLFG
jgi:5-methylcytosine-specific restriction endonuclease McrA